MSTFRTHRGVAVAIASIPLLWLALLWSYALRLQSASGGHRPYRWPESGDTVGAAGGSHEVLVSGGLLLMPAILLLIIVVGYSLVRRGDARWGLAIAVSALVVPLVVGVMALADPGNLVSSFVAWFMD